MSKKQKTAPAAKAEPVQNEGARAPEAPSPEMEFGPTMSEPQKVVVDVKRDRLFDLYVARVAKAETVHTVRRNGKAIFGDALLEARVALDVFNEFIENEGASHE